MTVDTTPGARRVEFVMGMPIVVDLRDTTAGEADIDAVFAWLQVVDETFSTYKESSEVSRINRGELALADAHPDLIEIAGRCAELRAETNGFFDATFDGATFDPSGLVKGWAVDRVTTSDGRWAYTLYTNPGGYPFVHALDTVRGVAHCVGVPWRGDQNEPWNMRLALNSDGRSLAVNRQAGNGFVAIDVSTWKISYLDGSGK